MQYYLLFHSFTVKQCISFLFYKMLHSRWQLRILLQTVEKKRASAKNRLAKHREKIHSNPVLLEDYRRNERERSGDRVIIGKGERGQGDNGERREREVRVIIGKERERSGVRVIIGKGERGQGSG
ncbi:hypothetical protein DPEC_G00373600 [Dallia pectoralis]|nr:hypothetical protein DPEC_G00373600 [Dallia pectoralis]